MAKKLPRGTLVVLLQLNFSDKLHWEYYYKIWTILREMIFDLILRELTLDIVPGITKVH